MLPEGLNFGGKQFTADSDKTRASAKERHLMLVVHIQVKVKPESVEGFIAATLANAHASRQEAGIARFDVVQQQDDPTKFVFVEAYRTLEATTAHKATEHYAIWRDTVASMMAEPRTNVKYNSLSPDEKDW